MYKDKNIPDERKLLFDWEKIYKMKKIRDNEDAEKYRLRIEKEIAIKGKNSTYIQTQYYVSFNVQGNRFTTIEQLNEYNIMSGELGITQDMIDESKMNDDSYIVASVDTAKINDYCAMGIGIAKKDYINEDWIITAKEFIIFNYDKKMLSPDDIAILVTEQCQKYKIDMLIIDTTAQQSDRLYYIWKELKTRNENTLLIPYDYSGSNKQRLFMGFEDQLRNNNFILPRFEYTEVNKEYKETIDELLYFKKELVGTTVKYSAPETEDCYDDMVNVLALLSIIMKNVIKRESEYFHVKLKEGLEYPIELHKNTGEVQKEQIDDRKKFYRY